MNDVCVRSHTCHRARQSEFFRLSFDNIIFMWLFLIWFWNDYRSFWQLRITVWIHLTIPHFQTWRTSNGREFTTTRCTRRHKGIYRKAITEMESFSDNKNTLTYLTIATINTVYHMQQLNIPNIFFFSFISFLPDAYAVARLATHTVVVVVVHETCVCVYREISHIPRNH
jgi:hypothetical protein